MATMQSKSAADALRNMSEFAASGQGGRALTNAAETWFNASSECQREMISFMSKRLERDGETLREMVGCKTLGDVAALQSRWIEETVRDYNTEMTKLMAIYTKSADIARTRTP